MWSLSFIVIAERPSANVSTTQDFWCISRCRLARLVRSEIRFTRFTGNKTRSPMKYGRPHSVWLHPRCRESIFNDFFLKWFVFSQSYGSSQILDGFEITRWISLTAIDHLQCHSQSGLHELPMVVYTNGDAGLWNCDKQQNMSYASACWRLLKHVCAFLVRNPPYFMLLQGYGLWNIFMLTEVSLKDGQTRARTLPHVWDRSNSMY